MTSSIWIAAGAALAVGLVLGVWLARRGQGGVRDRLAEAERELVAQSARAAEAARTLQAKAAKELQDITAALQAQAARAAAAHRAEIERLTLHLSQACDEVDRLRAAAARQPGAHDTGPGFQATMPLGDL